MFYKCPFCFSEIDINNFLLHIKEKHKYQKSELCYCNYCEKIFRNVYNYRSHLIKNHSPNHEDSVPNVGIFAKSSCSTSLLRRSDNNSRSVVSLNSLMTKESSSSNCAITNQTITLVPSKIVRPSRFRKTDSSQSLITIFDRLKGKPNLASQKNVLGNSKNATTNQNKSPSETSSARSNRCCGRTELARSSSAVTASQVNNMSEHRDERDYLEFSTNIYEEVGNFTASLYGNRSISRAHATCIIKDVSTLFNRISTEIVRKSECSSDYLSSSKAMNKITDNVFNSFKTEYRSKEFFKTSGHYIAPYTKVITTVLSSKRISNKRTLVPMKIKITLVPMGKVLKKFLELPDVFATISTHIEECRRNPSPLEIISPLQSKIWRDIEKKLPGKIVFPLIISYDDLEINNVLGSHRGVHKIGCIYFYLPCIPKEFRGSLENIFLAQLHHSKDLKKLGNQRIFAELKKQLEDLQKNGIEISINGEIKRIYFVLLTITGDNLGLHEILGFVKNFNSDFICRFCLLNKDERKIRTKLNTKKLRTVKNYNKHVAAKVKSNSKGILEKCIFNNLKHYHVISNMSVDELHDFLEGIFRKTIPKILWNFIKKYKYFSLRTLNWCIKFFDHGSEKSINCPPPLTEKVLKNGYLMITASEMKTLVKYLSMYVGDMVPEDCPEWKLWILSRKIYRIIDNGVCSDDIINEYAALIQQHHNLFREIFAEGLTPKFHFTLHYAQVMRLLGPVKFYSSMRPEGNHHRLKEIANATTSRLNPAYTIAVKNQLELSYRLFQNKGFLSHLTWNESNQKLHELRKYSTFKHVIPSSVSLGSLTASRVSIYGTLYMVNMCLSIGEGVFGKIYSIVISVNQSQTVVSFLFQKIETIRFSEHLQAFEINEMEGWGYINHKDLTDYKPLMIHIQGKKQYVLLL